jgi:hypothetical protein
MAYSPSSQPQSTQPPERVIVVTAVDANGQSAIGADVTMFINGKLGGELVMGDRPATFEISDPGANVILNAKFAGQFLSAVLGQEVHAHRFQFNTLAPQGFVAATPVARCPDATTGAPCIVCEVSGTRVRICV